MIIRIFSVLALTLLSFSFSLLAEAHPFQGLSRFERAANRLSTLPKGSSRRAVGDNVRQLGLASHNFLLRSDHEYPWQVGHNVSRDDGHSDWINLHSVSHSRDGGHGGWLDILSPLPPSSGGDFLRWQRGGSRNGNTPEGRAEDLVEWERRFGGELTLNYQEIKVVSFNRDGDLDLYLVNAPGGDNSFRFGGFLAATSIPEPSTLALVLFATLCVPFRRRCVQSKNG